MPYTAEQAAELRRAFEGRWKPIYQEVDGQMVQPGISAATMLELQSDLFKVEKTVPSLTRAYLPSIL